ncbi:peroxiredoxin [Aliikangiella coralliicola]|uniref:Glutathione-dependent peroxiredoxin n=1 Tax=Aliikangiella coralliicola TaxID=2592383 RepID=A0A545UIL7_9GAMM|nr:peroxiredoxin [Aliikangiella coralliicola]TQV89273.1 peroxiredoxin [Aliikangiella coralliicola]
MTIQANDTIPAVDVKIVKNGETSDISTYELFESGKTVLFGVPGAFTPTCSQAHLPGFVVQADELKNKGVDQIICMSVNDAFVMKAWGDASNAEAITMLADGNGDFSKALGLELDASAAGMGQRCKRFAMIIENNQVRAVFVEEPKQFEVSKAEYVLSQL